MGCSFKVLDSYWLNGLAGCWSAALSALVILISPAFIDVCLGELAHDLKVEGWREVTFKKKKENRFLKCGDACIRVDSDQSVSMISLTKPVNLKERYILSWEWKIAKPAVRSDITRKGRDDRALAIYVAFPFDPKTASLAERAVRPFLKRKQGPNAPGRMLAYIWAGHGDRDDLYSSPFFGKISKMIVKRNSSAVPEVWLREQVDIIKDHKRAFGTFPKNISQILISADTDNTKTSNSGFIRNIKIISR